jgi:hypothetical protein
MPSMLDGQGPVIQSKGLSPLTGVIIDVAATDPSLVYDTLLVAWVLGLALLFFYLGRFLGAGRLTRQD